MSGTTASQKRLKQLLAGFVRDGSQLSLWGCVIIALAGSWIALPTAAAYTFLASVGAELVAGVLERASRGEAISDDEWQQVLSSPKQLAAIQKLIEDGVLGPEASIQILAQAEELRKSTGIIMSSISSNRDASHQEHGFIYEEVLNVKAEQRQENQEIKVALDQILSAVGVQQPAISSEETALLAKLDAVLIRETPPIPPVVPLVQDVTVVNVLKSIGVQADLGMKLVNAGLMTREELIASLDTYVDVYFYDPRIHGLDPTRVDLTATTAAINTITGMIG